MFENIPHSIIGFVITGLLIWQLIPVAQRLGMVDKPGGHKAHKGHIPIVGGFAMFVGISFSLLLIDLPWAQIQPILFAGLLVLVVGTLDDKYFLSSHVRLLTQVGAALILVVSDNTFLADLGHLVNETNFTLGSWAIPLTVFAILGVINAINMTDGLDGLAGGLSTITLSGVTILLAMNGVTNGYFIIPLVFIATIVGFLMFNLRTPWLPKAKIFMGNGGSMLLGVLIAWLLIKFSQGPSRSFDPIIALWLFAIPLYDTVTIMLRRIIKGTSPFSADREHVHHLFLKLGFSVGQSVAWVLGIASVFALVGILGSYLNIPEHQMFFTFMSIFALYFWGMEKSWQLIAQRNVADINVTGGTDNSIINPLKRKKHED